MEENPFLFVWIQFVRKDFVIVKFTQNQSGENNLMLSFSRLNMDVGHVMIKI